MIEKEKRIHTRKQLREWLAFELPLYSKSTTFIKRIFLINESCILYKHQKFLRTAEYYTNVNSRLLRIIAVARLRRIQIKYSLNIPLNCTEKGLRIMHLGSILINKRASIGENCSIHQNVGIVAGGREDGAPIIGDNVVIGIGAIVLGNIHVADGVVIGANAVVNKDVNEPNIAVAGVPARKISNNGSRTWNRRS